MDQSYYVLDKPLKAIIFNHTNYDEDIITSRATGKTGLSDRSGEPGEQVRDCLSDVLHYDIDIDHKENQTKEEVIDALVKSNFAFNYPKDTKFYKKKKTFLFL